jgi:hypothetical protein
VAIRTPDLSAALGATSRSARDLIRHTPLVSAPPQTLGWSYAAARAQQGQARDVTVDRAVARLHAARARAEALELDREGKFAEDQARLEKTARRILAYAGDDAELRAIAEGLRTDASNFDQVMTPMARKQRYFEAYTLRKDRDPSGKAKR